MYNIFYWLSFKSSLVAFSIFFFMVYLFVFFRAFHFSKGSKLNKIQVHMKNKISLIIASCHAYEDVLEKLISQLEKNSFFDLGFDKVILATDKINKSKKYSSLWIDDVVVGSDWGERVRKAFHSTITEQSLLILDDYFLTKKIDKHSFYDALTLSKKFDCLYLTAVLQSSIKNNKNHKLFEELEESTLYKVNTTVGIWRKNQFSHLLKIEIIHNGNLCRYQRKAKNMKLSPNDSSQIYHSYNHSIYRGVKKKHCLIVYYRRRNNIYQKGWF